MQHLISETIMSRSAANKPGYFNFHATVACRVPYSWEMETLVYLGLEQPALAS